MGSPADAPGGDAEDGPQFEMTISQGFWLGRYAVTQAHWQVGLGNNPSHFQDQYPDGPVAHVNWYQATAFCEQLTLRFREHLPAGYEFGLPTEAQWEYACHAGTQTLYHSGNSLADLARVAWYEENSAGYRLADAIQTTTYYFPFGGLRGSSHRSLTTKRFTGQYHESSIPGWAVC
jgi:formylglycine-generating enzyme required for sulfatase activity